MRITVLKLLFVSTSAACTSIISNSRSKQRMIRCNSPERSSSASGANRNLQFFMLDESLPSFGIQHHLMTPFGDVTIYLTWLGENTSFEGSSVSNISWQALQNGRRMLAKIVYPLPNDSWIPKADVLHFCLMVHPGEVLNPSITWLQTVNCLIADLTSWTRRLKVVNYMLKILWCADHE